MAVIPANLIENNISNLQTLSIELKWLWYQMGMCTSMHRRHFRRSERWLTIRHTGIPQVPIRVTGNFSIKASAHRPAGGEPSFIPIWEVRVPGACRGAVKHIHGSDTKWECAHQCIASTSGTQSDDWQSVTQLLKVNYPLVYTCTLNYICNLFMLLPQCLHLPALSVL